MIITKVEPAAGESEREREGGSVCVREGETNSLRLRSHRTYKVNGSTTPLALGELLVSPVDTITHRRLQTLSVGYFSLQPLGFNLP